MQHIDPFDFWSGILVIVTMIVIILGFCSLLDELTEKDDFADDVDFPTPTDHDCRDYGGGK